MVLFLEKLHTNHDFNNKIEDKKILFIYRETVASQYFLELAKYVGLPVISWNADNAALEQVAGIGLDVSCHLYFQSSFQLQLAPTIRHQATAIMSLLQR